jgi:hypothetical protein
MPDVLERPKTAGDGFGKKVEPKEEVKEESAESGKEDAKPIYLKGLFRCVVVPLDETLG